MLNLLNASVGEYLKENVVLTVVLAIILALIAALSGVMIYLQVKAKKNGSSQAQPTEENADNAESAQPAEEVTEEPAPAEEPAKEEPAPAEEPAKEEPAPAEEPVKEEPVPAEEPVKEEPAPAEEPVKEEPAPAKTAASTKKTTTAKKTTASKPRTTTAKKTAAKSEEKKEEEKPISFQDGKWVIRKTADGKFSFKLYASNGGVMLESSKEYASLATAKKGIETYKKNFEENNCKIIGSKAGRFVYRLSNPNGMLLAVSSSYTSKSSCENALESTKHYALNAPIEVINV